ncbi:Molybdopterin synthase catalytic subunit [compost metagenome]
MAGGIVTFAGTVRNHNHGRQVLSLTYEAYVEMAQARMEALAREMTERWPVHRVVLIHRVGTLAIGDAAVFVGVSSAHRDVAFEACRHGIEVIKFEVPIWKKETFVGGEVWVEGCAVHA